MIVCDICKDDVAIHTLGTNKLVYALMPIEVGSHTVEQTDWTTGIDGTGLTQFLHEPCLNRVIAASTNHHPHKIPELGV